MATQCIPTIHLHRSGDFYETFGSAAETMAKALNIAVSKSNGYPIAGIPMHCADSWVEDLVAAGFKVVIHERMAL